MIDLQHKAAARVNDSYNWDAFNTDAYHWQYVADEVLWEDRCLGRAVLGMLRELDIPLRSLDSAVDICNGGVLRGPSIIAPLVKDEGTVYWADYGRPQLEAARNIIVSGRDGDLGRWAIHQEHLARCDPDWAECSLRACRLGVVAEQSIFELLPGTYDAGVTCFGPESLTADPSEYEKAVRSFISSVRPGGPVIMFYMLGSRGYRVAGQDFPAVPLTQGRVLDAVSGRLDKIQTFQVTASHGARKPDDPHGSYDGMGLIVGVRV